MFVAGWPLGPRPERSTASTVTAASPSFCAASMTLAPPPRSSSILSRNSATLVRARSLAISFLRSGREALIGRRHPRLDLADLDQGEAELALCRLAYIARRQREGGIGDGGVGDRRFGDDAEIDIGRIEAALLGEIVERRSGCNPAARRHGFFRVRENDLRHLAPLRRSELVAALFEYLSGVLVGDLGPFADVFRRNRDKGYLAIFGRAEQGFVVVEIGRKRLGDGGSMVPACAASSLTYSIVRCSFWNRPALPSRLSAVRGPPQSCRRSGAAATPAAARR